MSVFFEKNSKLDKICLKSGAAGVSFFVLYQLISVTVLCCFDFFANVVEIICNTLLRVFFV